MLLELVEYKFPMGIFFKKMPFAMLNFVFSTHDIEEDTFTSANNLQNCIYTGLCGNKPVRTDLKFAMFIPDYTPC